MLILFDVDATLITTSRTGIKAMGLAGKSLFGPDFDERRVDYAGRLDPLIIADLLAAHDQPSDSAGINHFRAQYRVHLKSLLEDTQLAHPCPGVPRLLAALAGHSHTTLGLLTGNFPETGAIKIAAAGIELDQFAIQVWGCDSPHCPPARNHLPEVAFARYEAHTGCPLDPSLVTVIGDTPHDVACARAHGCRSLAVATGPFDEDALIRAGADRVEKTLEKTDELVEWLCDGKTPLQPKSRNMSA